jgi:hypothetical protein
MRIKGYKVEPVEEGMAHGAQRATSGAERMAQRSEETPDNPATGAEKVDAAVPGRFQRPGGVGTAAAATPGNSATQQLDRSATAAEGARRQVWRLTSSSGQASLWVTAMIRAGDFGETDADVRSMPFPRIGIPDDPRWAPRGLTWRSLRHPIRNFRQFLRAKWNNSRCDLATFLGLRQPAWANDELLTLVAAWTGPSVERGEEPYVTGRVLAAADFLYGELKKWRRAREREEKQERRAAAQPLQAGLPV